jgi:transposase
VPAKLAAMAGVFDTGRKTEATDARSVALVALRATGLHRVIMDDHTVALRLMVDCRDELGRACTEIVNRLHKQLAELIPVVSSCRSRQ